MLKHSRAIIIALCEFIRPRIYRHILVYKLGYGNDLFFIFFALFCFLGCFAWEKLKSSSGTVPPAMKPEVNLYPAWYIRFPLRRILDILKLMHVMGLKEVRRAIEEYCKATGISKSNVRVILPTFTALGLKEGDKLSERGRLIAEAVANGDMARAADLLFECAMGNAVLYEIFEELRKNGSDANTVAKIVREVLKKHGYTRYDEVRYTTELVMFLIENSEKCRKYLQIGEKS